MKNYNSLCWRSYFLINIFRQIYRYAWKMFHTELYKNPIKYIPKNIPYCYEYTGRDVTKFIPWGKDEFGNKRMANATFPETKNCVFHKILWDIDLCMFNGSDCCLDSCKTCGISEGWDEDQ